MIHLTLTYKELIVAAIIILFFCTSLFDGVVNKYHRWHDHNWME